MKEKICIGLWCLILALSGCQQPIERELDLTFETDSLPEIELLLSEIQPEPLIVEKAFLYDQYTLQDTYPYRDTTRLFQWNKIKSYLSLIDSLNDRGEQWGVMQNRRNVRGVAPVVRESGKNVYKQLTDRYGVEQYQGIPLYLPDEPGQPDRYGRDGEPVIIRQDTGDWIRVETVDYAGEWLVPGKYIALIDTVVFRKVVFVDRTNQNIMTLEKVEHVWMVRSMNPATTGVKSPPYSRETPLGVFVVQEKKERMVYLVDGGSDYGGFAPYASRFTNGAYIHGVPVNAPGKSVIEYSQTLGTTPRSHMCVRNATSHAQFVYDWAPVNESLVVVIE